MATDQTSVATPGIDSRTRRFPLHLHISVLFTLLLLISGLLIGMVNYLGTRRGLLVASRQHVEQLAKVTGMQLDRMQTPVENMAALLSRTGLAQARTPEERTEQLPLLMEALAATPFLSAMYAGYTDGDFYIVRHLRTTHDAEIFAAPEGTRFLIQNMNRTGGATTGVYVYLDDSHRQIGERPMTDLSFDPRTRPWYKESLASDTPIRTNPYVFYATREAGQTFACRSQDGGAVIGADIALTLLSRNLADARPTPSSRLLVLDGEGQIIADSSRPPLPPPAAGDTPVLARLDRSPEPLLRAVGERNKPGGEGAVPDITDEKGRTWTLSIKRLESPDGDSMCLAVATPLDELLADAWAQLRRAGFITALILLVSVPLTWFAARRVSRDLRQLARVADSIRHFDFSTNLRLTSWVEEVQELSDDLTHTQTTIRKFLDLSASLSSEHDFARLEESILTEILRATASRAGTLYLMADDGIVLKPELARVLPAEAEPGAAALADVADLEALPLASARPEVARSLADGEPRVTELPAGSLPSAGMREAWRRETALELLLPLRNSEGATVGLIALYKPETSGEPAASAMISFARQLSGVAAVALENHRLLLAQEELMQAMIKILAGAIDAKSPYTGGHCQRVPVIATMLAEAACEARDGPYAGYCLDSEAWKALRIAAWLHDCGKVTTPEYVVDKATKLETIYNRIHEVRTRFEVLKREAEIACLKAKAAGADPAEADRRLAEEWKSLDDDFAFIAHSNVGGEAMDKASQERVARIAERTWTRTLSDRAGLSWEEKRRYGDAPEPVLPVVEPLLADRPDHLVPRPRTEWSGPHNPWGFTMKMPQYKFNLGEVSNLSIARGTLTEEERFIINDHIIQTIIMLSRLPFPQKLRRVPEMAGGHHERMDGGGYPRGLTGDMMSTEARMMAIADVFEALTAADRPYKKAKPLSESLAIMAKMARTGHLDPDLFGLFLTGGVHLRYAKEYLAPGQIDEVDVGALLAGPTV